MLGEARRAAIVEMLRATGSVTVAEVKARLGVSPATARRDLAEVSRRGMAQRTHGGAVIPSVTAQEDSFTQRLEIATAAKSELADAAAKLLSPRDTVFVDSSTTSYFVATRIVALGFELTLITNSLPVMRLVEAQTPPNVELVAVGGFLRRLTQSFVGPQAIRTIEGHFTRYAFVSVRAVSESGMLADVDVLEAEVKRAMIAHANQTILMIDHSKLTARALNAIGPISDVSLVLAHGVHGDELRELEKFEVPIRPIGDREYEDQGAD